MASNGCSSRMKDYTFFVMFVILGLIILAGNIYFVMNVMRSTFACGPWIAISTEGNLVLNGLALGMQAVYEGRCIQESRLPVPPTSFDVYHLLILCCSALFYGWGCGAVPWNVLATVCSLAQYRAYAHVALYAAVAVALLLLLCVMIRLYANFTIRHEEDKPRLKRAQPLPTEKPTLGSISEEQ